MYPQIYLGHIPTSAPERQALRGLAIELRARIHAARLAEPIVLLMHFAPTALPPVDLLLLSPHTALVGVVRAYRAAVLAQPGGRWSYRDSGAPLVEAGGLAPCSWSPRSATMCGRCLARARPCWPSRCRPTGWWAR